MSAMYNFWWRNAHTTCEVSSLETSSGLQISNRGHVELKSRFQQVVWKSSHITNWKSYYINVTVTSLLKAPWKGAF